MAAAGAPRPGPDVRGESFPPGARIRQKAHIQLVLERGWRRRTAHLVVILLPRAEPPSRLGLAVPRRVGDAAARNRVKRRVREAFRRRLRLALGEACADLMVQALPGSAEVPQAVLEAEIAEALATWAAKGRPGGRPRPRAPGERR